ncbi:MAG: cupin domain-containing protein [Planctomycetes bacterium]|nr:cupin domain-containing protein [Planctomycetota bacterium]
MRHVSIAFVVPGLVIGMLIAAGCATSRQTAGMHTSPVPFVRSLEDPADYHLLLTGVPQTCGMRSGRVRLAPGKSIGRHNTKGNEEILVFLSGRGTAVIGEDNRLQVGVGRVAYIPPQTAHDIVNTGTEPLVYVFCVAPAGAVKMP